MLIEVRCPNGHILHVREQYAGKIGACPRCGDPVRIPCLAATAAAVSDRLGAAPSATPSPPVIVAEGPPQGRHTWAPAANPSVHPGRERVCLECGRVISQSFAICPQCGMPVTVYHHLDVRRDGDIVIIQIVKPQIIDDRVVKEVSDELGNVLGRVPKHHIVLNLSKVTGLSSSMLGTLVMLERRLLQRRRRLRLCNLNAEVRSVLIATKLHRVLLMADSESDAIRAIQVEVQNEPPIDRDD
ncbi:MAG: STAS domain-containing protein [Planctomycetaceae bacterium]|nr:STAS domain-containing protein [Planctomycetaceae bacterium]